MVQKIQNLRDIKFFVDAFYNKLRKDDMIGPIFNKIIQDKWFDYLDEMHHYWFNILSDDSFIYGNPFFFANHGFPQEKEYYERWIELFYETLDENFEGEFVDEVKWKAAKIAQNKILHNRNTEEIFFDYED